MTKYDFVVDYQDEQETPRRAGFQALADAVRFAWSLPGSAVGVISVSPAVHERAQRYTEWLDADLKRPS